MENFTRLNKFIASNGVASRRKIDEYILQGRVSVNGRTIVELGYKINPDADKVALDGEAIRVLTKKIYIILNKPKGVITSVSDEKHRETVIDLIKIREKIFPVGRLDFDTSGLLLLTNDGDLANKLMHPKSEIDKTYFVKLSKPLEEKHRLKLSSGIRLDGVKTSACRIRFVRSGSYEELYISIHEGRNRQVRNMFEHFGYYVRDLERVEYAGLRLAGLGYGEWRYLNPEEVRNLYDLAEKNPGTKHDSPVKHQPKKRFLKKNDAGAKHGKKNYEKAYDKKSGVRKDFTGGDAGKKRTRGAEKFEKKYNTKNLKWGFKSRIKDERNERLGFRKFVDEDEKHYKVRGGKKEPGKFQSSVDKKDPGRIFRKSGPGKKKKAFRSNFVKFDMRNKK